MNGSIADKCNMDQYIDVLKMNNTASLKSILYFVTVESNNAPLHWLPPAVKQKNLRV